MSKSIRAPVLVLVVLVIFLAACTRERPVPDFITAPESSPDIESPIAGGDPVAEAEPQVDVAAGSAQTQTLPIDPLGLDTEPEVEEIDATPTPDQPETFAYTVRPGDTLTGLAQRFETDIATLRNLNALDSDVLAVGQPLEIPYVEGMTAEGAPTPTPGPFYYTVQAGDTLSAIAARFNTDHVRLVEINNLLDPNNLVVGSQILIPDYEPPQAAQDTSGATTAEQPSSDAPAGRFVHIVQPGEGLMEIAARYGIDMNEIAAVNNLVNRNVLRVGQELIIPGITARDAAILSGAVHIVQAGESLLGIALRYGVTVDEIIAFNEITNPDAITVGQQLIIPRN